MSFKGDDGVELIPAGTEGYMGNNGFETDGEKNKGADYSDVPASNPLIANVTVVTTDGKSIRDNSSSQAAKFDDAIKSQYYTLHRLKIPIKIYSSNKCLQSISKKRRLFSSSI